VAALEGLKGLGLVGHRKGQTRYHQTGFKALETVGNRKGCCAVPGRAARFWALQNLVKLTEGLRRRR
jgi:hypothetical protein